MRALRTLVVWTAAVAWPLAGAAQPAGRTFDQLATLVTTGDTLEVSGASGEPVAGRLLQLTGASLTLEVEGEPRSWAAADVRLVRQRYRDPLWNGALIGAVTGAVAGAVPVLVDCWSNDTGSLDNRCHSDGDAFLAWCTAGAAGGAALGTLFDLSHASRRTVYEGGGRTVSMRPILAPSSHGLLVTLRF
jgi:hypothetical protein